MDSNTSKQPGSCPSPLNNKPSCLINSNEPDRQSTQPINKAEGRLSRPSVVARARQDNFARRSFFTFTLLPVLLPLNCHNCAACSFVANPASLPIKRLALWDVWRPSDGQFGFWPFILGTFWVTTVGVVLAVPACLLTSIYLAEYAHARLRSIAKPVLDLLAAIPPVVYGVWDWWLLFLL